MSVPSTYSADLLIRLEVVGTPVPQGSKSAIVIGGRARVVEGKGNQRAAHKSWRATVAEAARESTLQPDISPHVPLDGALTLDVEFRFPMPAARSKRIRTLGRSPKSSAPDLDKLVRSVGDSLKEGGLIVDDARFVEIRARKVEVVGWTGAVIHVIKGERRYPHHSETTP